MRRSRQNLNERIERWVTAETNAEDGDPVAGFVTLLRSDPAKHRSSVEEMVPKLAQEAAGGSVPVQVKARAGKPLPTRWRRRAMLSTFLSTLIGKLLIGSVALAATTGGLAATDSLPEPAQVWVAENLKQIGIEVPNPGEIESDDRSGDVLDVIEGTDPSDRDQEFGENVGDTASDGISSDFREQAYEYSENEGDVADQYTPDVLDEVVPAGDPGDNAGSAGQAGQVDQRP